MGGWIRVMATLLLVFLAGCGQSITAREARARLDPARRLDTPPSRASGVPSLVELAASAAALPQPQRQIVESALAHTGMPAGKLDCSALAARIYAVGGIELPRTVREQLAMGGQVGGDLEPGDLVFFAFRRQPADHVGIFTGQGAFVHISASAHQVRLESMASFSPSYVGARRFRRRASRATAPPDLLRRLRSRQKSLTGFRRRPLTSAESTT